MRFLVIGTNFISDLFADAIRRLHADGIDAAIGAVLSRRAETGRAYLERCGAAYVPAAGEENVACDPEAAEGLRLRGAFDAVYVASPNVCHESQSVFFLERGVPVLCEKPAALTPASLAKIGAAAKSGGAVFMEAMRPTHDPVLRAICQAIGEIAPVRSAHFEFSQYSSRYDRFLAGERVNTFDPSMGNSALYDLGVYALADALALFGEPTFVTGAVSRLENGFEASGAAAAPSVILGEHGAITIDRLSEPKDVQIRRGRGGFEPLGIEPAENNMVYEIADFIAAAKGEASAGEYYSDSVSRAALVDRIMSAY